jgi:hypothetical protein
VPPPVRVRADQREQAGTPTTPSIATWASCRRVGSVGDRNEEFLRGLIAVVQVGWGVAWWIQVLASEQVDPKAAGRSDLERTSAQHLSDHAALWFNLVDGLR